MEIWNMELPEIVNNNFVDAWWPFLSNTEYHADKTAISSTSLKSILKSPATFLEQWCDITPKLETDAMRFGTLVHTAILETNLFFKNAHLMPEFGDLRISKNRDKKKEWLTTLSPELVIVTEEELIKIGKIIKSVESHQDASTLLKIGMKERSGFFRDECTGIKCKIRPDCFNLDMRALIDIKTTQDCTREEFSKTIWNYRYDIQMAFYSEGIRKITGASVEHIIWIAIEKEEPFEVSTWIADDVLIKKGLDDYYKAMELLHKCIVNNAWPRYQTNIQTIELPRWVLNKETR